MWREKKLGYQNQGLLRASPSPTHPPSPPISACGASLKMYPRELDPICKSEEQSLLLILRLGCHGAAGINICLVLVCWVFLGLFVHLFFFFIPILETRWGYNFLPVGLYCTSHKGHWSTGAPCVAVISKIIVKSEGWCRKIKRILEKPLYDGFES